MRVDRFLTTQWSKVLAAAEGASPDSAEALADLCRVYWYPLYAFVRRGGHSAHEAEDLTQEFFARLMERDWLKGVGPEKGRFRSFLVVCLRRFLANQWDASRAEKRGGGRPALSIDFREADDRYRLEPAHEMTADRIFERRWILTLLEQVLAALEDEFTQSGKKSLFDSLRVFLVVEHNAPPYAEVAGQLGISEGAVKTAVHRLRRRYRKLLRAEVAKTLADAGEVDEEIRRFFEAIHT